MPPPRVTLAEVARRGFTAVEPYDFVRRAAPLAASLTAHGLAAPTGHAFLASASFVNPDGSGTSLPVPTPDEVFDAAEILGMGTVIDPYTEPARWETREQIEETARLLNAAAEIAARRGLRVGYHNHTTDFNRIDGEYWWNRFADQTAKDVVLQFDTGNASEMQGVTPQEFITRNAGRTVSMHVKPFSKKDPNAYLGADELDWPAIMSAAESVGGIEWYIIEYEKEGVPPLEAL